MSCQVQLDNSGRAWFDSSEKLTEDALGDGTLKNGVIQVYERTGTTTQLIKGADGNPIPPDSHHQSARLLGASSDGERVYISTQAPLAPDDADQVPGDGATDGYELSGGRYTLLTTGALDSAAPNPWGTHLLWASDDGRYAYFETGQALVPEDWDSYPDIYQRAGGQTRLVSTGPDEYLPTPEFPDPRQPDSRFLGASPDGSTAYFATAAHLTADDPGKSPTEGWRMAPDIFAWHDGVTTRLTRTVSPQEVPGTPWEGFDPYSFAGATEEGSVYFVARSGQIPEDTDQNPDIYRAKPDGTLERVLHSGMEGANSLLHVEAVSRDGSRIFLLKPEVTTSPDQRQEAAIYMWSGGRYQLLNPKGDLHEAAEEEVHLCSISGNGRRAYFQTWASLSPQDTDSEPDVYEWSEGTIRLVSPASDGRQSAAFCSGISPNGRFVAFSTWEQLVPGDADTKQDIYVIDMDAATASASVSRAGGRRARGHRGRARRDARHGRRQRRLRLVTAEAIPPRMRVARRGHMRGGGVSLRLRCPRSESSGPCHGRIRLLSRAKRKVLAGGRFRIPVGRDTNVRLRWRRASGRPRVALARVRGADQLGNAAVVEKKIRVRRGRRHHPARR